MLELIPNGEEPLHGNYEPGLMIARNTTGEDIRMRVAANATSDLTVNSLGLGLAIFNGHSGERQAYNLEVGFEDEMAMPPRLRLMGPV